MKTPKAHRVYEVSYEVCNKVGGIYTVVSSKAQMLQDIYDNYLLIGPYFEHNAKAEFKEEVPPSDIAQVMEEHGGLGIRYHYGTWMIKGNPKVILIEFGGEFQNINDFKGTLWEKYQVDSLSAGFDFDEPLAFSLASAKLINALANKHQGENIVCHTHEWMTGFCGLYLKSIGSSVKTVFTTHATMLGRSIAGSGQNLYGMLENINPEQEAQNHNVVAKYSAEKACAKHNDVFVTVSDLTAYEAEKILGIKPDVVTKNGLDSNQFPPFEDIAVMHQKYRERLREFCMYYFFPYYTFDLSHTLFMYTSGRHEVHNKGIDITVAALAKLNQKLIAENSKRNVVVFFWVPHETFGPQPSVIESKMLFKHIKNYLRRNQDDITHSIMHNILTEDRFDAKQVFSEQFYNQMHRLKLNFNKEGNPPLNALLCHDDHEILKLFYKYGLLNRKQDKVKVILYPTYLTGVDGVLNMSYYEAISGCHLGLFPSYYEPWGYTPAESIFMGIPAVTSDLAGFGLAVNEIQQNSSGVFVLPRRNANNEIDDYAGILHKFTSLNRTQRIENKIDAKRLSLKLSWSELIEDYISAHNLAIEHAQH